MNQTNVKYKFFYGGVLSNFHRTRIVDENGHEFFCSEQKFMYDKAMTFKDEEAALKILEITDDPSECKKYGRQVKDFDQKVWDEVKYDIMYRANYLKYSQSENLLEYLASLHEYELVEASPYDRIWGIGYNSYDAMNNIPNWGQNLLGKILTDLSNKFYSDLKSKG